VASIICQKTGKPTFIYKMMEKESQGTVRSPIEINSVSLMKKCKKLLLTYGGHPTASGFRIKNENLGKLKECLIKNMKPKIK
jgi:single-stranded-DNA-specific exonuclease